MLNFATKCLRDMKDETAIEFGLITGQTAVANLAAVMLLGTNIGAVFGSITTVI